MAQPETVDQLLQDLRSPDSNHRRTAAEALGRVPPGEERITAALSAVAVNDDDRNVRIAASNAFVALNGLNRSGHPGMSTAPQPALPRRQNS